MGNCDECLLRIQRRIHKGSNAAGQRFHGSLLGEQASFFVGEIVSHGAIGGCAVCALECLVDAVDAELPVPSQPAGQTAARFEFLNDGELAGGRVEGQRVDLAAVVRDPEVVGTVGGTPVVVRGGDRVAVITLSRWEAMHESLWHDHRQQGSEE